MSATEIAGSDRAAAPTQAEQLLTVRGLNVSLGSRHGAHKVLRDVDLDVPDAAIVGLVGETGSGKTTLARAIVGLAPISSGTVQLRGRPVSGLSDRRRRAQRRSGEVQYVFQDPLRSLDPDLRIRDIVGEGLAIAGVPRAERSSRIAAALRQVGLETELQERWPGQISGGQRQRVAIARAVVMRPRLLICDEPVSALDVSNRNHVLQLLADLRDELGVGIILITHDLGSLASIADTVAVLYRGQVVETGPVRQVFSEPRHTYTQLLMASIPTLHGSAEAGTERRHQLKSRLTRTPQ